MLKGWHLRVVAISWFMMFLAAGFIGSKPIPAHGEYVSAEVATYTAQDCETENYVVGPKEPVVWTPWNEFTSEGIAAGLCREGIGGATVTVWPTTP